MFLLYFLEIVGQTDACLLVSVVMPYILIKHEYHVQKHYPNRCLSCGQMAIEQGLHLDKMYLTSYWSYLYYNVGLLLIFSIGSRVLQFTLTATSV
jgi:hypothetical protein